MKYLLLTKEDGNVEGLPTPYLVQQVHDDGQAEAWFCDGAWRSVRGDAGTEYFTRASEAQRSGDTVTVTAIFRET